MSNARILFISDPHFPYQHPDALAFWRAVKQKHKPTRVIFAGDIKDHHADSYHEHDPDLPSAGDEHRLSNRALRALFRLFPKANVLESNHGALPDRKAKTAGLSSEYLRVEKERIKAPKAWTWHKELIVKTARGLILFVHGNKATNKLKLYSLKRGLSIVQGHYHSRFEIEYWNNGRILAFALTSGCLIDDTSPAFDYNKDDVLRPILGCVMIIDGVPQLIPMHLKRGRWTGRL